MEVTGDLARRSFSAARLSWTVEESGQLFGVIFFSKGNRWWLEWDVRSREVFVVIVIFVCFKKGAVGSKFAC